MTRQRTSQSNDHHEVGTLSRRPLVAWYGDDFTGAAATMEALTFSGVSAILFLDTPDAATLAKFADRAAIGVASTARAQSPAWMDAHLPGAFRVLDALRPEILHYKVCSTLDSAAHVGSIGRAIEIGADLCGQGVVPILVAAPQMRRYQCFGTLFAAAGDTVYRLDRHPVMARHPVTPMHEADVARHIAAQSDRLDPGVVTLEALARERVPLEALAALRPGRIAAISVDCCDAASEAAAGRLLWENRERARFVVGSQGVEYALIRHWRAEGLLESPPPARSIGRAQAMAVVSGSVSPTNAEQVAWARAHGFETLRFDIQAACADGDALRRESSRLIEAALEALSHGRDPLIFTAEGPDDPAVARMRAAVATQGRSTEDINEALGSTLGQILRGVMERSGLRRAAIAGGDTSGNVARQLDIVALEALAPTIPGAAIFRARADGWADGLELALKGGQMGSPDYFGWIRNGGGPA